MVCGLRRNYLCFRDFELACVHDFVQRIINSTVRDMALGVQAEPVLFSHLSA